MLESSEETITRLQDAGFAAEARIELLERALAQKDAAIRTMSDVRQVGMLAQFNELDGEYNRLFERHAKVQQELFDAQAAVRTLSRMAQKI